MSRTLFAAIMALVALEACTECVPEAFTEPLFGCSEDDQPLFDATRTGQASRVRELLASRDSATASCTQRLPSQGRLGCAMFWEGVSRPIWHQAMQRGDEASLRAFLERDRSIAQSLLSELSRANSCPPHALLRLTRLAVEFGAAVNPANACEHVDRVRGLRDSEIGEYLDLLIENRASVDARSPSGAGCVNNMLHLAGLSPSVRAFIERGAGLNLPATSLAPDAPLPLEWALLEFRGTNGSDNTGRVEAVAYLLEHGADPCVVGSDEAARQPLWCLAWAESSPVPQDSKAAVQAQIRAHARCAESIHEELCHANAPP